MAKTPKFIEFSELSENLRDFIQAGAKIFPIDTYEDLPLTEDKEYYRIVSGTHKNEVYTWSSVENKYVLIGADDREIKWTDILEKPNTFPATPHTHTVSGITDFPATMPPSAHTHTENEITNLDKYTQLEVDTAITNMGNTKANIVHTHTKSSITDFAHGHPISEIVNLQTTLDDKVDKVAGKALSTNDYTTDDKNKLIQLHNDASFDYTAMGEALTTHKTSNDHDGRYNTKTEITNALSAKAENSTVNGHIGNTTVHVTQGNKDAWSAKWDYNENTIKAVKVASADNADTVNNLTVETAVPSGALFTDTIYTHPANHPASMITESTTMRFVSDTEKTNWNAKGSSNLALGTTSSTAYRGDHGLTAYNHSQVTHAPSNAQKNSDITKDEIEAKLTGTITTHSHTGLMPANHASTHASGGTDVLTPADIGAATSGHNHSGTYEPTFSKNTAFNKNFGTTVGTVCQGNDSRLSDARTPTAHTHTLANITDSGSLAAINTNASTSNYLRGDGMWVTPPNTTYSAMSVAEGLAGTDTSSRAMRADFLRQIAQHYAPSTVSVLPTTNLHAGMTFYKEV